MRAPFPGSMTTRRRPARTVRVLLTALVATALVAACGGGSGGDASGPGGTTTVTVGVIPILDVAPVYLGVKQGFFKDQGLELKLQSAQGGAAIVPGVVSGQYQFGFSNTTSLLVASSQGLPLKVVSEGVASTGVKGKDFGGIVVAANSPIRTAADLAGKRVAVNTLKNINTTTINKVVRDAGADPSKIAYTELAFPDIVPAVTKGDVDAGQVVEPFLTIAKQQGLREIASNYAETDPKLTVGLYFTSQKYATEHADTVKKFATAMQESLKYANDHPDAARAILPSYTKIDPGVQAAVTLPSWPDTIDSASIGVLSKLALQDGLITSEPDITKLLP